MIPRRGIIGWISAAAGFAAGQAWDLIKTVQAAIPSGVVLLPPNTTKPVRQIRLVDVTGKFLDDGSYGLVVNAEMELGSINLDGTAWFNMPGSTGIVQIRDFAFGEDPTGSGILKPKYGSIRFASTDDHFHLRAGSPVVIAVLRSDTLFPGQRRRTDGSAHGVSARRLSGEDRAC